MTPHRWSGWPGAWCLDCGCNDPIELAMADGAIEFWDYNPDCHYDPEVVISKDERNGMTMVWRSLEDKEKYAPTECPEPGSKRHDPYAARLKKLDN